MKKKFIFGYIAGLLSGVIIVLVISAIVSRNSNGTINNLKAPVAWTETNVFEVFQVVDEGVALCNTRGKTILFVEKGGNFYDELIFRADDVIQTGTYSYSSIDGQFRTIPVLSKR